MIKSKRPVFALMLVAAVTTATHAQQYGKKEMRRHYRYADKESGLSYRVTEIFQMPNDSEVIYTYLLADGAGDRLILTSARDYLHQTSRLEIMDLQTKERLHATSSYPYKSATLHSTLEEARANPQLTETWDPPTTVELGGASASAKDSEWTTSGTRDRRSSVRRAGSPQFLERLERLRPIAAKGPLDMFCAGLLRYVLYNETCARATVATEAVGDCNFDASFGYPCSERQKERVSAAALTGDPARY